MPRSGWRKPESDRRLPDLVSVGLLMKVFPAEVVDAVIAECGRTEQRRRSLPARSMAYFAMGMALHSEGSYEDVLALISDGIAWAHREEGSARLANKAAISHARDRLGSEPMALLFDRVAEPLAEQDTPGCWLAGRRLVAIDGTCLDLADTPANDSHFGRPGVMKGERSAFPQARVVALAECGTHAMFEAVIGPYTTSENALSGDLLPRLTPGMLCLADRGFYSFTAWHNARATGADLLWRVKDNLKLEPVEDLFDGSWLAEVFDSVADRRRQHPLQVRVIEYTIQDGREPKGPYRLLTTILDPAQAPAAELAAAYAQRWEIETAFDELKTHQRGPRAVLRSKSPDLVTQEIWGHLCCHYAIRTLMLHAADHAGRDPDRVSFVAALRISRRSIAQQGAFSPSRA
ncbi:IS4 family transposase [Nocardioides glacieisoli]|uniref:IS4 family transposase n=1 Tax=Nocardioides glacieisoli TaxID=1168730 RepID=A0A4Q2RQF7_9ACTN|nr:IS4 family transposase [Nocardioides glacieisoli]RYB90898.1 IS4 family transposase [Nocardioides glacieisoli]